MLLYIRHPSGPCGDIVHSGHYKNNWTELNIDSAIVQAVLTATVKTLLSDNNIKQQRSWVTFVTSCAIMLSCWSSELAILTRLRLLGDVIVTGNIPTNFNSNEKFITIIQILKVI